MTEMLSSPRRSGGCGLTKTIFFAMGASGRTGDRVAGRSEDLLHQVDRLGERRHLDDALFGDLDAIPALQTRDDLEREERVETELFEEVRVFLRPEIIRCELRDFRDDCGDGAFDVIER